MKISIIDMGTQSLKHYIFEAEGNNKKTLHYKRYSEANLGEHDTITPETIDRNINILKNCLEVNSREGVKKLQILGTEILRKASNAKDFTSVVKKLSGHDMEIISHDQEAKYLYEGFINIVPDDMTFAAMNIGGGSTEVVIGNKHKLIEAKKIPFGVKYLRKHFWSEKGFDWEKIDAFLAENIVMDTKAETVFVTGVLDFVTTIGPHLGFVFDQCDITNHPVQMNMKNFESILATLRTTPLDRLKSYYPKDPVFAEGFVPGQSVYVEICRKIGSRTVIPSNNDLTDGVVHGMLS